MRRRMDFTAAVIGKGGLYNISLMLDSPVIGHFRVELNELNLSDEEKQAIIDADQVEGVVYFNAMTKENNGVLKVLELRSVGAPAPKAEETKSLSKEFNGKILMDVTNPPGVLVETDEVGTIHVDIFEHNVSFDMYENGVKGTYELKYDDEKPNVKTVKVTSIRSAR